MRIECGGRATRVDQRCASLRLSPCTACSARPRPTSCPSCRRPARTEADRFSQPLPYSRRQQRKERRGLSAGPSNPRAFFGLKKSCLMFPCSSTEPAGLSCHRRRGKGLELSVDTFQLCFSHAVQETQHGRTPCCLSRASNLILFAQAIFSDCGPGPASIIATSAIALLLCRLEPLSGCLNGAAAVESEVAEVRAAKCVFWREKARVQSSADSSANADTASEALALAHRRSYKTSEMQAQQAVQRAAPACSSGRGNQTSDAQRSPRRFATKRADSEGRPALFRRNLIARNAPKIAGGP